MNTAAYEPLYGHEDGDHDHRTAGDSSEVLHDSPFGTGAGNQRVDHFHAAVTSAEATASRFHVKKVVTAGGDFDGLEVAQELVMWPGVAGQPHADYGAAPPTGPGGEGAAMGGGHLLSSEGGSESRGSGHSAHTSTTTHTSTKVPFPFKREAYQSEESVSGHHYELGPKLKAPSKGVHCLEVDDQDGAACGLFTYAPVQNLPGLSELRPCTSQDRFTQGWLPWTFGGISFAIASGGDTTPKRCADFINSEVYSAAGGATGGQVNCAFCLKYQWACEPSSLVYCKLESQAKRASSKWSGAWTLSAFNGLLGTLTLLATIGYASYPLNRACRVPAVRQWAVLVDTYRFYLAFFYCAWTLLIVAYCQYLRVIALTSNIFQAAWTAGLYYQVSGAGHVLAFVVILSDTAALVIDDARGAVIAGVVCNPGSIIWALIALSQTWLCWVWSTAQ
ncbi:unnamed protein product [Symbiodinium sp. KB8]|nr:unnamed protein product [Symbiodinium sp. KB8]